jgi:hypothetical protein
LRLKTRFCVNQLNVLRRQSPKRPTFEMLDRLIFAGLYRLAPKVLSTLAIMKPEHQRQLGAGVRVRDRSAHRAPASSLDMAGPGQRLSSQWQRFAKFGPRQQRGLANAGPDGDTDALTLHSGPSSFFLPAGKRRGLP